MEEEASTVKNWGSKWQYLLDKASPHIALRWLAFTISFFAYVLRVYLLNGWYIVTYGLGIYLLSQLIGFITPQFDPEDSEIDLGLPVSGQEEFRPFARRLPEFKFWLACLRAVWTAFLMTFFEMFDIPVFWPVLLFYFLILFFFTMKKQIRHMIKHRYLPFSFGKAKYQGKAPSKDSK